MRVLHTAADTTGTAGATGKHSGDGIGVSALVGAAVRSVMAPLSTLARVVRARDWSHFVFHRGAPFAAR